MYIITRRQALLIMVKQAAAMTILSGLTCVLYTTEVAGAIFQQEQAVVAKTMVIEK